MRFYALVEKDGDSAFGMRFPDLPGCFSAADTLEDVEANAIEALTLWFEDAPEVSPAPLAEIRSQPDVRRALAEGAFLISVPRIRADDRKERLNITMPTGLRVALDAEAGRRKTSRSALIAEAVRNALGHHTPSS